MRYIFSSQSLYKKPKSSEEEIRKVKDVTARLTDPKRFPKSHQEKLSASKRERDGKLTENSYQSLGRLAQSNDNLSVPKVFDRLARKE